MRTPLLLALSVTTMGATGALAGGYVAPIVEVEPVAVAAVPTPSTNWTGFYVGAQVGRADLDTGSGPLIEEEPAPRSLPLIPGIDTDGRHYGVHVGYLHDFGRFVGGAELSYDKLDDFEAGGAEFDGNMVKAKLLAGYNAGKFLPYAAVSVARAELDTPLGKDSDTGFGYGLGVKYMATPRILVGAEWMRHQFDYEVPDSDFGDDADLDTFGINVSYRF